ncbi:MAG: DUF4252 domain-containing protein [Saprospiraceae bacterium]|nr:DUF4252 domain-containing protein [Saprospiraceae bacterium]
MKWIMSLALMTALTVAGQAQIKAVEAFIEDHPNLDEYYVYQSTLRMINQEGDPDFNRLIKDIRKINIYISEGSTDVTEESYREMLTDLANEGFEVLINAKYEATLINMMSKDAGNRSYYVLAVRDTDNFGLMEMDGSLDLRYLKALEKMDFGKLQKLVMDQK